MRKFKILSLMTALCIFVAGAVSLSTISVNASTTIDIGTVQNGASGAGWSFNNNVLTVQSGANVTITGRSEGRRIVVDSGTITLRDAHMRSNISPLTSTNAFDFHDSSGPNLYVKGRNTLASPVGFGMRLNANIRGDGILSVTGIEVLDTSNTTTLFIQDSVTIISHSNSGNAGISGWGFSIGGNSTVTAVGGRYAAGIGGSPARVGGEISITDSARVTATGGRYGAGVGSGRGRTSGIIWISNNAHITATGGQNAAGIGGGKGGVGGSINIFGSPRVTAIGGQDAAGIGGGRVGSGRRGAGGFVSIIGRA